MLCVAHHYPFHQNVVGQTCSDTENCFFQEAIFYILDAFMQDVVISSMSQTTDACVNGLMSILLNDSYRLLLSMHSFLTLPSPMVDVELLSAYCRSLRTS